MRPSPRHARLAAILASGWFNLACDRKPDPDRVDRRDSVNGLAPIDSVIGADNAGVRFHIALSNPADTAFTSAPGENRIRLQSTLPRPLQSAEVSWKVERAADDGWAPVVVPSGPVTEISVTPPGGVERYQDPHPASPELRAERLKRLRIRYRVSAVARSGSAVAYSDTLTIEQSMLATVRQEYLDLGLRRGAPPLEWFKARAQFPAGLNYGDFEVIVAEPEFASRLAQLERVWRSDYPELEWRLTSLFRNPTHNRFHVAGGGSGPVSNSWHQFGCAADLQTYPRLAGGGKTPLDSANARQFWDALAHEAQELDFDVEPRDKNPARPSAPFSGVGHVHIETDCIK